MLRATIILLLVSSLLTTTVWVLLIPYTQLASPIELGDAADKLPDKLVHLDADYHPETVKHLHWQDTYMELNVKARLGNQLFAYAALREFSTMKNSTPIIFPDYGDIAAIFKIKPRPYVQRDRSGFAQFTEMRRNISGTLAEIERLQPGNISFHGYFQSPKYFETVKREIRNEYVFVDVIATEAKEFLRSQIPKSWLGKEFIQVGIHVRRTDHVSYKFIEQLGFRFPPPSYFELAMAYFEERHSRVQFIVASDDPDWCRDFFRPFDKNVAFSTNHSAAVDLAIMASCSHSITTIGTFSWWAGWLCPGITIYYANYNKRPSWVSMVLNPSHYIPDDEYNHWIAMRREDDKNVFRKTIITEEEWEAINNI
ncbi:hypothetical protein LSH36_2g14114 [Paralvinella palmiformis]|uniref:L-Fucosyltransferase n=1 Tax=Paralvinella palmiformis TaxID=53620 RepID=A0AAD9KGA6_9ANNE|nr:hypothetical protein LSH36_2g14114 [Paralvinella palmiformis]